MTTWAEPPPAADRDRVPVDDIRAQAREIRFTRVLVTLIAGTFFAIGWVAGRLWLGVVFAAVAVRYGYREGAGKGLAVQAPRPGPPGV